VLPDYHLARPRLTDLVLERAVCVVIGGAGYGKSALAAETRYRLDVPAISTVLEPSGVPAALLPYRLRSAAARVGLSDLATRMDQAAAAGPAGALDAILEALGGAGALIIVDEIQNAEPDAVALLIRLAGQLGAGQRLLLLGRNASPGLDQLRRAAATAWLGTADLAMTVQEIATLCRSGFGLQLPDSEAAWLRHVTDGWPSAVVLAATQALSGDSRLVTEPAPGLGPPQVLAALTEQILRSLPEETQAAVQQIAHLPLLNDGVVTRATGLPGILAAVSRAGLPLQGDDSGYQLIGPVQDLLTARAPALSATVAGAAAAYAEQGRLGLAADLLIGAGQPDRAAALLAAMSPQQAERLGLSELTALTARLPSASLDAWPGLLLHLAREYEPSAAIHRRTQALHRGLAALGEPPSDPALAREIQAEIARDLVRDDDPQAGHDLASAALAQVGPQEERTAARLLEVLGLAAARYKDPEHLARAADQLSAAAERYRSLRLWSWRAHALARLGTWVHQHRGAADQAIAAFDESLAAIPAPRRQQRAVILTFRAEALVFFGRYEEAEANLAEAEEIALVIGDVRVRAYVSWERGRALSQQGDAPGTLAAIHQTESFRSDWFDGCGGEFLSDAADCLDRVGYHELALGYLTRAREQSEHEDFEVDRAAALIAGRSGDPEEAERLLVALSRSPWCEPAEQWRVQLLRAAAAQRRGDPAAAALALDAMERAARIGSPALPLIIERAVAEQVLGLLAGSDHPVAASLATMTFPVAVRLLGGFGVSRGGRPVEVPPGQGRQLVKLVAVGGGRLTTDAAMEALWPGADPEVSANRLRTVLNRLKEAAGDVVIREDRILRLGSGVQADVQAFEQDAGRARALAAQGSREAVSAARAALSRFRGDLLPEDPYEPWAELPRERLRRQALVLLDLCARSAAAGGDLDEAVRCLERGTELAPDEEDRYVTAARHLLTQGRRGAARMMLQRARSVVDELGVRPPAGLLELEHQVRPRRLAG
jgi:DNA-binding SARP family transcriptional activator/ATP/maltotriose-dependent transcriptional regulator MalT